MRRIKKRLGVAAAMMSGLFLFAQPASPADGAKPKKDHKVTICHKGKTISVGPIAAVVHVLIHGDTLGSCEAPPVPPPGGGAGAGF